MAVTLGEAVKCAASQQQLQESRSISKSVVQAKVRSCAPIEGSMFTMSPNTLRMAVLTSSKACVNIYEDLPASIHMWNILDALDSNQNGVINYTLWNVAKHKHPILRAYVNVSSESNIWMNSTELLPFTAMRCLDSENPNFSYKDVFRKVPEYPLEKILKHWTELCEMAKIQMDESMLEDLLRTYMKHDSTCKGYFFYR